MASIYDPSSEEWIGLLVFLSTSALAAFSFVHSSASYHWKVFYRRSDVYTPPLFIPELYSTLRVLSWLTIGLGVWFGWREGFRSEEIPPVPVSGVIPTTNAFFLLMLFYIIFLGLSTAFAFSFFGLGLNLGWMGVVLFFDLATLASIIVMIIYGWKIWFLSGLLILVGGVYACYSVVMVFLQWLYLPVLLENTIADPFDLQGASIEKLYASSHQPRVEATNGTSSKGQFFANPQYTPASPTTARPPQKTASAAAVYAPHPSTPPQNTDHMITAKFH